MGKDAAEFGTAVTHLLLPDPQSKQMGRLLCFAYSFHLVSANTAEDKPPILKYNGRTVPRSFPDQNS
jgi:hypothetical protein